MLSPDRTPRQRIVEALAETPLTAHQLAQRLGIPERQVEDHLAHVVKTLARDRARRFILEPATCPDCGFIFRERTKLTRPSRCPRCRRENLTPPRFSIEGPAT